MVADGAGRAGPVAALVRPWMIVVDVADPAGAMTTGTDDWRIHALMIAPRAARMRRNT